MSLAPEVQVALITVAGLVAVALIGVVANGQVKLVRMHRTVGTVREQVQNGHSTNLRDDVDRVISAVDQILANQTEDRATLKVHSKDVGQLREDVSVERQERLAVAVRVDNLTTIISKATP